MSKIFVAPTYSFDTTLGPSKLRITIPIPGLRLSTVIEFTKFLPKICKKPTIGEVVFNVIDDGFLFEFYAKDTTSSNYRLKVHKLGVQLHPKKSHYILRDNAVDLILVRNDSGTWSHLIKEGLNVDSN